MGVQLDDEAIPLSNQVGTVLKVGVRGGKRLANSEPILVLMIRKVGVAGREQERTEG